MNAHERARRLERFAHWSEWPLALLALAIIPALLLDDHVNRPEFHRAAEALNWIVWLAFCGEIIVKAWLSGNWRSFLRQAWFDLLIVLVSPPFIGPEYLQGVRLFRLTRLARLIRLLRAVGVAGIALQSAKDVLDRRKFHYVTLTSIVIVSLGALGMYGVESGRNAQIQSLGDAFWWSAVTASVGYGDVSPTTTEGRLIAVVLMLVGIGFISILTATIASSFVETDKHDVTRDFERIEAHLKRVEQKQDELIAAIERQQQIL